MMRCPATARSPTPIALPAKGLSRFAGGHTDPHSALGMGSLAGALAAKAAMEKHGITGTIRFMGEPAEKVRGSKPIHAAAGYYDGLDAIISFHPHYMLPYCNTCRWDTHCGPYCAAIYEFLCEAPETWLASSDAGGNPIPAAHTSARAPGANDAVVAMFQLSKLLRDHMLPHTGTWTLNETILASGQATADNLAAQMAMIMYAARAPDRRHAANDLRGARSQSRERGAARPLHGEAPLGVEIEAGPCQSCHGRNHLSQSRARRPAGFRCRTPSRWRSDCRRNSASSRCRSPSPMNSQQLIEPQEAEARIRREIPVWQTHYTSDDYTDMTWHAPTVRFYIGRASLKAPAGFAYPEWAMNALGGIPATIDPTVACAAKTIAGTILDLMSDAEALAAAKREFAERLEREADRQPWCDYPPPLDFPWPDYVETKRGRQWWIPATATDRKLERG